MPKDDGGINLLGTGKKVLGKLFTYTGWIKSKQICKQFLHQEELLSEKRFLNSPYKEMFPNYQSYTANYFKTLQPTQYTDEATCIQRFVAAGGGQPIKCCSRW